MGGRKEGTREPDLVEKKKRKCTAFWITQKTKKKKPGGTKGDRALGGGKRGEGRGRVTPTPSVGFRAEAPSFNL